ncbi:hypothetical protein NHX12_024541 [Muraenolepis orangiensis]|uniref:Uncharacterized protein n=1 Tax=Muraenolepis orangiensis TaxID=630683 RepID=A0A9Q0EL68_9TELE|nr:hypothetical protein NHX12_024541 [Muraenolepis orangiensis]
MRPSCLTKYQECEEEEGACLYMIPNQRRLVRRAEVDQHMLCWQNLLTAQSLELTHLINSLDQEAGKYTS